MSETCSNNDRIPTEPTQLGVLLLLAAAVVGHMNSEQVAAVTAVFGFATTVVPFLPRGGR